MYELSERRSTTHFHRIGYELAVNTNHGETAGAISSPAQLRRIGASPCDRVGSATHWRRRLMSGVEVTGEQTLPVENDPAARGVAVQLGPAHQAANIRDAPLGLNPLKWRAKVAQLLDGNAKGTVDKRLASLGTLLSSYSPEQRKAVTEAVPLSFKKANGKSVWSELLDNRMQLLLVLLFFAVLPAVTIFALAIGPPIGWKARLGAVIVAILVAALVLLLVYNALQIPRDSVIILAFLGCILLVSGLAIAPTRWQQAPDWFRSEPAHVGTTAAARVVGGFLVLFMAWVLIMGAVDTYAYRRRRRSNPGDCLIDAIGYLIQELPTSDDPRTEFLRESENAAQTVELYWPKSLKARYPKLHEDQEKLARQIAAAVRGPQLAVCVGAIKPAELRKYLVDLLVAFVTRDIAAFDLFEQEASSSAFKVAWWRRTGRITLAAILFALAITLLVAALWQPGFPDLLRQLGWTNLSEALVFDERYRAGIAAGALGLLRAVVSLLAAPRVGGASGREADGGPVVSRRRRH